MANYSIVICTYNRVSFLKETIESILSSFGTRYDYELLIIDNNSTDATAEVTKQFLNVPVFRYILEKEQGLSHARNRGIKEATKDVIIFVDDDIDIDKNYLDHCERLYKDPTMNIVGGKVLPYKANVPDWLPSKYYYLASMFDIGNDSQFTGKLMGANYSMRKEVALKIGWYNPELGRKGNSLMAGEENDYFSRAQQLGYQIFYDPQLIVYHKIENKLNKEYIFNYSLTNGQSEAMIELNQNKLRYFLKVIKSLIMLFIYYVYGFYAPNPKQRAYYKINQLSALGYLKVLPQFLK